MLQSSFFIVKSQVSICCFCISFWSRKKSLRDYRVQLLLLLLWWWWWWCQSWQQGITHWATRRARAGCVVLQQLLSLDWHDIQRSSSNGAADHAHNFVHRSCYSNGRIRMSESAFQFWSIGSRYWKPGSRFPIYVCSSDDFALRRDILPPSC